VLNQCLIGQSRPEVILPQPVALRQIIERLWGNGGLPIPAQDIFQAVSCRRIFFLVEVEQSDIEFVLGKVIDTFGQLLFCRVGIRRAGVVLDDAGEISLGDLGSLLVAVAVGKLVEIDQAQMIENERDILIGWVQGLEFLKGGGRLRVLFVQVVGLGEL